MKNRDLDDLSTEGLVEVGSAKEYIGREVLILWSGSPFLAVPVDPGKGDAFAEFDVLWAIRPDGSEVRKDEKIHHSQYVVYVTPEMIEPDNLDDYKLWHAHEDCLNTNVWVYNRHEGTWQHLFVAGVTENQISGYSDSMPRLGLNEPNVLLRRDEIELYVKKADLTRSKIDLAGYVLADDPRNYLGRQAWVRNTENNNWDKIKITGVFNDTLFGYDLYGTGTFNLRLENAEIHVPDEPKVVTAAPNPPPRFIEAKDVNDHIGEFVIVVFMGKDYPGILREVSDAYMDVDVIEEDDREKRYKFTLGLQVLVLNPEYTEKKEGRFERDEPCIISWDGLWEDAIFKEEAYGMYIVSRIDDAGEEIQPSLVLSPSKVFTVGDKLYLLNKQRAAESKLSIEIDKLQKEVEETKMGKLYLKKGDLCVVKEGEEAYPAIYEGNINDVLFVSRLYNDGSKDDVPRGVDPEEVHHLGDGLHHLGTKKSILGAVPPLSFDSVDAPKDTNVALPAGSFLWWDGINVKFTSEPVQNKPSNEMRLESWLDYLGKEVFCRIRTADGKEVLFAADIHTVTADGRFAYMDVWHRSEDYLEENPWVDCKMVTYLSEVIFKENGEFSVGVDAAGEPQLHFQGVPVPNDVGEIGGIKITEPLIPAGIDPSVTGPAYPPLDTWPGVKYPVPGPTSTGDPIANPPYKVTCDVEPDSITINSGKSSTTIKIEPPLNHNPNLVLSIEDALKGVDVDPEECIAHTVIKRGDEVLHESTEGNTKAISKESLDLLLSDLSDAASPMDLEDKHVDEEAARIFTGKSKSGGEDGNAQ